MPGDNDFLADCMDSVSVDSSVDEFQQVFCSRCYREECSRSQWGKPGWLERMRRQKRALDKPELIDPNRPEVRPIAQQNFEDARNLSQDAWSMPDPSEPASEGGFKVHKAEPPTETSSSDKVDGAAAALYGDGAEDESADDVVVPDTGDEDDEHIVEDDTPPDPDDFDAPEEPEPSGTKEGMDNTDVPEGGILLEPEDGEHSSADNTSPETGGGESKGDWTHPEYQDTGGGLTVNIDDGSTVDD